MEIPKSSLIPKLLYLLFAVCPILFFTDLTRNPYYSQIILLQVFVLAAWGIWLWDALRRGELVWVYTILDGPFLILIGISLLSWGNSFFQHPHFFKAVYSEGSKGMLFLLINSWMIYAAAVRIQDRNVFKHILWLSYAVSFVASVYGIAQYFGMEWIWPHNLNPYGNRPVSTFGNPNFMSSYLVTLLPVVVADCVLKITKVPRFFLMLVIGSMCAALFATLTRSSWAGAIVGICLLCFMLATQKDLWIKIKKPIFIILLGLGIGMAAWPNSSQNGYHSAALERLREIRDIGRAGNPAVSQRFLIWTCAWDMVEDHPFLGKGWGCFELFYPFYQGPELLDVFNSGLRTHANNAHNEILEYWSQIGTIGLGIVIWFWILLFRAGKSIAQRQDPATFALVWGMIGGIAGMLVDNLLNVSVHFAVPALIFWWFIGGIFMLDPASQSYFRIDLRHPLWRAAVISSLVAIVLLIGRAGCLEAGEINFFSGFKLSKANADLLLAEHDLQQAYAFHHLEVNNNYELANVEARMGKKAQALYMYQRALDANGGYDEIYFNRATVLAQQGDIEGAVRNYRMSLEINPTSHETYTALASIYLKDLAHYGVPAEALCLQAVKMFPADRDFWNNYGYLETQQSHWEQAFQAYAKAVQLDPDFNLGWQNLHAIIARVPAHQHDPLLEAEQRYEKVDRLIKMNRWPEALPEIDKVVQQFPNSFRAHLYQGNILFSVGKLPEAAAAYKEAIRLQPNTSSAWQNLAVVYERLGQPNEAKTCFQRVYELDPSNALAKSRLNIH